MAFLTSCLIFGVQSKLPKSSRQNRVTREAFHNVARHSGVRRASVSLVRATNRLLRSICDTGVGFDRELTKAKKGLELCVCGWW